MYSKPYRGRFAPSPTGALHAGSLVAALASWLDARAHGGQWLVRIEDVDTPRTVVGATQRILQQLSECGLHSDGAVELQSRHSTRYQQALEALMAQGLAYPCYCTRKAIQTARAAQGQAKPRHGELVYPGTCRPTGAPAHSSRPDTRACAWRFRTDMGTNSYKQNWPLAHAEHAQAAITLVANLPIVWTDGRLGELRQDLATEVGDFVLKRADGCFTYQLAVVVDDAAQGITHVVRGEDLADNTARQILLQRALHLPTPRYLHTPLVLGENGEKLSKQNGALAIATATPAAALQALNAAARVLGLPPRTDGTIQSALEAWIADWLPAVGRAKRWPLDAKIST